MFSSDSLSEVESEPSVVLFKLPLEGLLAFIDSNVELLLDGETEYSEVLPSSEASCCL